MDKDLYAIITPDPYQECKFLVVEAVSLGDVFTALDDYGKIEYKIKIVKRTEGWFNQFQEI